MEHISWDKLWINWESKQKSFEDLCMFLFCRDLKITKIDSYKNQAWIETEPIEVSWKKYWFQSKFFDSTFNWNEIKQSIEKWIRLYPNLNKIFIYSNREKTLDQRSGKKTKKETDLEAFAKSNSVELEYITDKDLLLKLSQPQNLDIAQLYFWIWNEYWFIKNSVNSKIITFLQSSEYINIPIISKKDKKEILDISTEILSTEKRVFLLLWNPWSWKSIFMHDIFYIFAWLDKKWNPKIKDNKIEFDLSKMNDVLLKNNAIPVLINLKNCNIDSLESIIRWRKDEFNLKWKDLDFIYIFDGLDELDETKAEIILYQIYELSQKNTTKKIIISSRSWNLNILKTKTYFNDILEFKINDLWITYIDKYFKQKDNKIKIEKLKKFKKNNKNFISEIKDILLIKLFWDTIETLNEYSTIIDLFDKKVNLLLDSWEHRKNIEKLNLLNSKKQLILELNQDISFEFQKKFQFRFYQSDLQKLILNKFDRLDYRSANIILNYIADLFFENSYQDITDINNSYIYQHRRYQEYFFTKKLKLEFEKDSKILRDLKVISNREYLEKMLLPYLRQEYEKENNLPWLVELNLINIYLWNHKWFWADEDYYMNSKEFILALTSQDKIVFNELFEDENLKIKDKISINFEELEKQFKKWNKDKDDYRSKDYLKAIWVQWISSLIEIIVLLWKNDKKDIANKFRKQLQELTDLYDKYEFSKNIKENDNLWNPFWNQFENRIYYRIVILGDKVNNIFLELIRKNYNLKDDRRYDYYDYEEKWKEKLVKSFIRVWLETNKKELFKLIKKFDEYEFTCFLEVLSNVKYLSIFIESNSIHKKIKDFILSKTVTKENIILLFFKKIFSLELLNDEITLAESQFNDLRNRRSMDWSMYKIHSDFAIISFILDRCTFEKYLDKQEWYQLNYYNELWLYWALFKDFIKLLKNEKSIEAIVRDYLRYINIYTEWNYNGKYLKIDTSFLFAYIFSIINDNDKIVRLKDILVKNENNIIPYSFYLQLNRITPDKFSKIINRNDLSLIESELNTWNEDFQSYINKCFDISIFFSKINIENARYYFYKGINDWILRHWYHKDYIVSYSLTDAFKIIWKNNWTSNKEKEKFARIVFDLTLRVTKITDWDHTWRWPYLLVDIISENNIELAEKFKNELIESEWYYNSKNQLITSILKWKINYWIWIEELEQWMEEYRLDYDHEGKHRADYYEQKFIVYIKVTESDIYTDEEKKTAFEKAYIQCEELIKQEIKYYLRDDDFEDYKIRFKKLCKKYWKEFNLSFDKENNNEFNLKTKNISEEKFISEVKKCETEKQLNWKYKKLDTYKNWIIIKNYESWKILIDKTYEITWNIDLLLKYLQKNNYPHSDYWTSNSKYYHYAIQIWLDNINTKQETLNYLYKNSGYEWFKTIMYIYESMWDWDMCLKLFNRYLKFCDFIVN